MDQDINSLMILSMNQSLISFFDFMIWWIQSKIHIICSHIDPHAESAEEDADTDESRSNQSQNEFECYRSVFVFVGALIAVSDGKVHEEVGEDEEADDGWDEADLLVWVLRKRCFVLDAHQVQNWYIIHVETAVNPIHRALQPCVQLKNAALILFRLLQN